ncbi:cytoskeletal protein binding protein [Tilletia horrida]|nr:cytoskeletal protein binding protein [Tilletia horrida]
MAYVAYCKALYDYAAQAADELALAEDDVLYILENDDAEWWKAKLKKPDSEEEAVGLVPANYVEEAPPLRLSRALYDYTATSDEELTVAEDELLRVYETDGPWLLVQKHAGEGLDQGTGRLGFVPANYVDEVEALDAQEQAGIVPDPDEAIQEAEQEAAITASAAAMSAGATAALTTTPAAAAGSSSIPVDKADDIKMWSVQIVNGKKKKKGTLGIGNASLFFASESDKAPVQRINVLHIEAHSLEKSKQLYLELSEEAEVEENKMQFQLGSSKDGDEIVDKLEESISMAKIRPAAVASTPRMVPPPAKTGTPLPPPPPPVATTSVTPANATASTTSATALPSPARKTVSFSAPAPRGEPAIALYDFTAEGEDELSVAENEEVHVLERENDDWWKVRNKAGQEGVVPASYVETTDGTTASNGQATAAAEEEIEDTSEADAAAAAEAAAVAAAADEAERAEKERREARLAEQRRQEIASRKKKEEAERQRREALKAQPAPAPPQAESRPRNADAARSAAKDVQIPKGRSQPDRPKDATSSRSRPDPYKTRIWQDVSGKFSVEAQYMGLQRGKVRLHKINGVVIDVPVEKMSKPDIQYLEEVTGKRLLPSRSNGTSSSRREGGVAEDVSLAHAAEQRRRESAQRDADYRKQVEREQRYREREKDKDREREKDKQRQSNGKPSRRNVDWFEFFLAAGVDVDDCTRYASTFERDKIDESILADITPSILRSLGLREGDIIRVSKFIEKKYGASTGKKEGSSNKAERQIKDDERLARKLQEQESAARRGETTSSPPPNLFSGPDGSLKTTRRGRPNNTPKTSAVVGSIDATALASARDAASTPPSRAQTTSPEMIQSMKRDAAAAAASRASGFDDDAWTPRPPSTKPATPAAAATSAAKKPSTPAPAAAPPAPTPPPAPAAPPAAVAPAVSSPAPVPAASPAVQTPAPDPNSALFEKLAAMRPPSASTSSPVPALGPGSMTAYNPNAPRGPLAPVPANQGLLQPLIPTGGTGQFVPTRTGMAGGGLAPMMTGYNGMGMGMGMQPQMTGWQGGGSGMMSQPTGYGGFGMGGMNVSSPGSGFSSPGMMAPMTTGIGFSGIAAPVHQQQMQQPAPQQQQQQPTSSTNGSTNAADKFSAANVFAQMKSGQFGKDSTTEPQSASRYDALRPQPTGFQPGGVVSQPTGFAGQMMPQQQQMQFPMGMQMTGFPGQQQQQQQYPGYGPAPGGFGYQQY